MKVLTFFLFLFMMMTACSSNPCSQNLTWYNNVTISNITKDPDRPDEMIRIAIGISAQVFYISKKSLDYRNLIEKATQSLKKNKTYNIDIENKTNIIKKIKEIK